MNQSDKNRDISLLYASTGLNPESFSSDTAHIEINRNRVLGTHLVPGFSVEAKEFSEGVEAVMEVAAGTVIEKPVHICFGMLPARGIQKIILKIRINDGAGVSVFAHCTFPNAVDVQHLMDAEIEVGKNAAYSYFERHLHADNGGVKVVPRAEVRVDEGGSFRTEFELLQGRVGLIDIDYHTICYRDALMEMKARINGKKDDKIKIKESGELVGERSRGVLTSHIALRDNARADIDNILTATGAYARGHVDCKEIVRDQAVARAVPVVEVQHPKAHVTHEAAIGSVDTKQLETLMARGLTEDEASDLIIQGLLS